MTVLRASTITVVVLALVVLAAVTVANPMFAFFVGILGGWPLGLVWIEALQSK